MKSNEHRATGAREHPSTSKEAEAEMNVKNKKDKGKATNVSFKSFEILCLLAQPQEVIH